MSGVWGLAGKGPASGLSERFASMGERLKHHDFYVAEAHLAEDQGVFLGRMSLGILDRESQPAFNEDRSLLAMMEGEFFDADVDRLLERHELDVALIDDEHRFHLSRITDSAEQGPLRQ